MLSRTGISYNNSADGGPITKFHLYEFRSDKKKLKCLCGWERTLKTSDPKVVHKMFADHCQEASVPKPS